MGDTDAVLSMKNITKIYSNGFVANKGVSFSVKRGTIHALAGENGAGKTTLMKVLFGIEKPTEGYIEYEGNSIHISSTNDAIRLGIGMVHQHFKLVPSLTVAENIVQGQEPKKGLFFDKDEAIRLTQELSDKFKFDLNPRDIVEDISVSKKQKVEILKALYRDVKLLILDEPTAVLTPQETEELFEQLVRLKKEGITIIFISHKLNEIKQICDEITIMRRGAYIGTYKVADLTEQEISRLMVGRDVILDIDKAPCELGNVQLNVKDLSYTNDFGKHVVKNISLEVRSGEILAIAGIEGAGQREIVEMITGIRDMCSDGSLIEVCGNSLRDMSIKERRKAGLAYIPEDRNTYGVAAGLSIRENLISSIYDKEKINNKIFFKQSEITDISKSNIKDYDVRCTDEEQLTGMLSGGNMQKVIIAREFSTEPKLLVVDQPTRGVDVGAIEFIHKKLVEIRDAGCAVLLVSADLNEVLELADRVVVMCQGRITARFDDVKKLSEEMLGYYMLGIKDMFAENKEGRDNIAQ